MAYEKRALVRVPAPVLAEVCCGTLRDAAVLHILNERGIEVIDLTGAMARTAGGLLKKAKLGSAHAVDAFVVATALAYRSAVIATHDPDDLRHLATGHRTITIFTV